MVDDSGTTSKKMDTLSGPEDPVKDNPTPEATKEAPKAEPPTDSDSLREEAVKLQKEIVVGMPTRTEMSVGQPRTVNKHRQWEKDRAEVVNRYCDIRQTVSGLPSVEDLRQP